MTQKKIHLPLAVVLRETIGRELAHPARITRGEKKGPVLRPGLSK